MEKSLRQHFFHIPSGLKATIPFLISGLCVASLFHIRSINFEIFKSVLESPQLWFLIFIAHQSTTYLTAARWKVLIGDTHVKSPRVGRLFLVVWASQVAMLIPLGFEVTRFAYMFKALKMTASEASKTTIIDRLYEIAGLVSVFGLAFLGFHIGWPALFLLFPVFFLKGHVCNLFLISAFKHVIKAAAILTVIWNLQVLEFSHFMEMAYKSMFGLIADALPVSWNGLGVGHLAFEFQIPGKGAEIYSIFFAVKTFLNFAGIFPLIWLVQKQRKATIMLQR